jgi:hypothetical protein
MGNFYSYSLTHKYQSHKFLPSLKKVLSMQKLAHLHTKNQCTRYQFLQGSFHVFINSIAKYLYDTI